jgi:hypothetical protein
MKVSDLRPARRTGHQHAPEGHQLKVSPHCRLRQLG